MIDHMSYKQAKDLIGFEIIADEEAKRQQATAVSLSHFFASIQ